MWEDVYESFSFEISYDYGIVWLYVIIFFILISFELSLLHVKVFAIYSSFLLF